MVKYLIYVLYYDDASRIEAEKVYGNILWAKLTFIETTKYCESNFIMNELEKDFETWKDLDYVGTISWKAHTKVQIPVEFTILENALDEKYDLIYMIHGYSNWMKLIEQVHPLFMFVWNTVLTSAGFSQEKINSPNIIEITCNYWLMRPNILIEYIKFLKMIEMAMNKHETILEEDSGYVQPSLKYMEATGKIYYMYHPFILERMVGFFAYIQNLNMCMC